MSKNLEIKLNHAGVGALLKSVEMQEAMKQRGRGMVTRDDSEMEVWNAPTRAVVQIKPKREKR